MTARQDTNDTTTSTLDDADGGPAERARLRQNTFVLRTVSVFGVALLVALFSIREHPRFMFVAPLAALLAWAMDGALARNLRALAQAATELRRNEPYWRNVLHPRVSMLYLTLCFVASLISVDAPAIQPGDRPSELTWYVLVVGSTLFTLFLVGVAWISELAARSSAVAARPRPSLAPLVPQVLPSASPGPFPRVSVPPPVQQQPVPAVRREAPEPAAGPFPPPAPVIVAPPANATLKVGDAPPAFTPPVTLAGVGIPLDEKPKNEPTQSFGTVIE